MPRELAVVERLSGQGSGMLEVISHPFVILLLGAVLIGLVFVWRLLPSHRRRAQGRFLDGRLPLPPEKTKAWIRGTVRLGEPLVAPLTGRACVYWRVTIELWQGGPYGRVQRFRLWKTRDFDVETESGGRVRIAVDGLEFEAPDDALRTPSNPLGDPVTPGRVLENLLTDCGEEWDPQGLSSVLAREATIAVEGRVEVSGHVRHDVAAEGTPSGLGTVYRDLPKRLVLVGPGVARSLERAPADLAAENIADNSTPDRPLP